MVVKHVEKARRRSPAAAREAILDAAESILLDSGPVELKFAAIARRAGVSPSTAHHHFGGIIEIQDALANRMLSGLIADISAVFNEFRASSRIDVEALTAHVYEVIASKCNSRLIAWLVLSADAGRLADLVRPFASIEKMAVFWLSSRMPEQEAARTVAQIMYRVAIMALGDGLIGETIKPLFRVAPLGRDMDVLLSGLELELWHQADPVANRI